MTVFHSNLSLRAQFLEEKSQNLQLVTFQNQLLRVPILVSFRSESNQSILSLQYHRIELTLLQLLTTVVKYYRTVDLKIKGINWRANIYWSFNPEKLKKISKSWELFWIYELISVANPSPM